MYKKDKKHIIITFVMVFIITFFLELDFNYISSDCISIVSCALAIYAICIGALIGSPLLENLQNTVDSQIRYKTQLGIIKQYIKNATFISVITLIFSCVSKLKIGNRSILLITNKLTYLSLNQFFSSLCFGFFSLNFIFVILIFTFIINKQVDS